MAPNLSAGGALRDDHLQRRHQKLRLLLEGQSVPAAPAISRMLLTKETLTKNDGF
jgi:hypothetical protein